MKLFRMNWVLLSLMFLSWRSVLSQDSIFVSLDAVIDLAFQKNTTIVISNYEVSTSKFALKEAKANFLPKLYLSSSYNRNIDRQVIFLSESFGDNNAATKLGLDNEFRSSLHLSLPIYSSYNFANKKLSETQYDFQNEAARGVRHSIINATKKAYFNYLIVQEIVKVQESRLKNANEFLEDIQKRLQRGTLTEFDVSSAKVQVAIAKSNLLEAQSNKLPAANALKLLLGLESSVIIKLTEPITLREDEIIVEEESAKLIQKNSQLKQSELTVVLNEKQLQLAKSAYYPTIDAIGNYNYQTQANNFKFSEYDWAQTSLVGLQLQIPVFNGTVTKNRVQQLKFGKKIAEEEKEYVTKETKMRFKELVSHLEFARQKVEVEQENMTLTAEALKLAKKRYELGVGTILEVNDAELAYTQSRLNWLQAVLNYKSTYYDYQLLIGKD
ncbi:TolC family protein [Lutibacter sp.]|uniref:TolC family protein n=1 Tax=Lutibacter sp. TaxID=1925666 RepID=UPI003567F55E